MSKIKAIFKKIPKDEEPRTDFSEFFFNATSGEKKKLMTEVIREANSDQKALIEKYDNLHRQRA
jgi:hypothetical protein